MNNLEYPKAPEFYPKEEINIPMRVTQENTLQSIDNTLKRIEKILIQVRNQFCTLDDQDLLEQRSIENLID